MLVGFTPSTDIKKNHPGDGLDLLDTAIGKRRH
jgi:hypothetical protein